MVTEKVEEVDEDQQMSVASGEYDKQQSSATRTAPKKKEKKPVKKAMSEASNESGIRMGGNGENNFCDGDDDMEEDEIMRRELGENSNSVAESSQRKTDAKGATTTDTSNITDRTSSKKVQPKQSKVNEVANSNKSTK